METKESLPKRLSLMNALATSLISSAHSGDEHQLSRILTEMEKIFDSAEMSAILNTKKNGSTIFHLDGSKICGEECCVFLGYLFDFIFINEIYIDFAAKDAHGRTPLNHFIFHGCSNCAEKMLDIGATSSINMEDNNHLTPLLYAAYNGDISLFKFLIKNGAKPTKKDGIDELSLALNGRHNKISPQIVEFILQNKEIFGDFSEKVYVEIYYGSGNNILHLMVICGATQYLDYLSMECIKKNINKMNHFKITPIYLATKVYNSKTTPDDEYIDFIKKLIDLGADISIRSPYDYINYNTLRNILDIKS